MLFATGVVGETWPGDKWPAKTLQLLGSGAVHRRGDSVGKAWDWSRGKISAPHRWSDIANAVADGSSDGIVSHPLLLRLHGCGTGDRGQNIHFVTANDICFFR